MVHTLGFRRPCPAGMVYSGAQPRTRTERTLRFERSRYANSRSWAMFILVGHPGIEPGPNDYESYALPSVLMAHGTR